MLAAALALGLGVALLEGYVYGFVPLVPSALFMPPAQPLEAVLFVLTGASLLALATRARRLREVCAALATTLAALLLAEYVFAIDLPVDWLLFADQVGQLAHVFPGRPAPMSCAGFLGLSLLLLAIPGADTPPRTGYSALLVATTIIPLLAIAGHLGDVPELYGLSPVTGIGLHTAIGLLALAIGIASSTHRAALVDLVTSREPGTVLLRRLLPLAVVLPMLFAAGSMLALRLGFYQVHVGLAVFVSLFIGISLWAAFRAAGVARRLEAERRAADRAQAELALRNRLLEAEAAAQAALQESEEQTRELLDILSHAPVIARGLDGRIRFWSAGAERLYGWSSEEATGAGADDLLHTELPVPQREVEAALLEQRRMARGAQRGGRATGSRLQVASHWILHRDADRASGRRDRGGQRRHRAAPRRGRGPQQRGAVPGAGRGDRAHRLDRPPPTAARPVDMSQWVAFTGQIGLRGGWRRLDPRDPARGPARGGARLERGGARAEGRW